MAAPGSLLIRFRGQELRVEGPVTIGREPGSDLLCDDPRVSRRHAVLQPTPAGWELEDIGSANGTYCNGQPVTRLSLLSPALIRLANPDDGVAIELIPVTPGTVIERPRPVRPPDTIPPGRLSAINRLVHDLGGPEPPDQ